MYVGAALFISVASACGGGVDRPEDPPDLMVDPDEDGDGFGASIDCDDSDRFIYPGAPEPCDHVDNNCDGIVDDGHDLDGDMWTVCDGDCRDADPTSFPGAPELEDGFDNNCDGVIDNNTSYTDDDGDGYSEDQGDCNDQITDLGQYINPAAVEVQLDGDGNPEGIDNDCDGQVDEALSACGEGGDRNDPWSYADAIDACNFVSLASWNDTYSIDERSRGIFTHYGDVYVPQAGPDFFVLSSGVAADASDPAFVYPQSGTMFENTVSHPSPLGPMGCSSSDPGQVNDYSEVVLRMQVPSNASAFSFDFNFMSVEFPEWVCSSFDDTFLALLQSSAFTGNVSFDAMGNRVSINVGFFDVCDTGMGAGCTGNAPLFGTGYETDGGGTGWLTTTAPVTPGEKITLRFAIFDEGDHILDSMVMVDNFRWEVDDIECPDGSPPPCTIGIVSGADGAVARRSRFIHASPRVEEHMP